MPSRSRFQLLATLSILAGFGLRIAGIDAQGFWVDEGHTLDDVTVRTLPFLASLAGRSAAPTTLPGWADVHPPLYFLSLVPWVALAGTGEAALRFPSTVWSVLTIAVLFFLTRRLIGPGAAVLAALFGALSPFGVAYSQEARMYSLLGLEVLAAVVFGARLLFEGDFRLRVALGYVVAATAALHTHYFAGFCLLALNALVGLALLRPPIPRPGLTRSVFVRWAAMQLTVVVLFLPWTTVGFQQWNTYPGRETSLPPLRWVLGLVWMSANLGPALRIDEGAWALVAIGLLCLVGLCLGWAQDRQRRPGLAFLVGMMILPVAAYAAVLLVQPHFHPRYLFPAMLIYYAVLGGAAAALGRVSRFAGGLGTAAVAGAMLSGVILNSYNLPFLKDEAREVAQSLNRRALTTDAVLVDATEPIQHYYRGAAAYAFFPNAADTPDRLGALLQRREGAWLVQWWQSTLDSAGQIPFLLSKYGRQDLVEQWRGYRLLHYQLTTPVGGLETGETQVPLGVLFEPGVRLVSAGFGATSPDADTTGAVASGGLVWAALHWSLVDRVPENAKATVQLIDIDGNAVAHDDRQLLVRDILGTRDWEPGWETTTYHLIPLPTGLPPGPYRVQASLYWKATESHLRPVPSPHTRGEAAVLGQIPVSRATRFREPTSQEMPVQLDRSMSSDLTLLGFGARDRQVLPGEQTNVLLYWRADRTPAADYTVRVVLQDAQGSGLSQGVARTLAGGYPTSSWTPGEVIRGSLPLTIAAGLNPGPHVLSIELLDGDAAPRSVDLFELTVLPPPSRSTETRQPQVAARAAIGRDIELLGYDLEPPSPPPGATVRLALYWAARAEVPRSYSVFTQLLDAGSRVAAQHDGPPVGGGRPTSSWRAGEVIRDEHPIELPRSLNPGTYRLQVGMYDPQTLERLPLAAPVLRVENDALQLTDVVTRG